MLQHLLEHCAKVVFLMILPCQGCAKVWLKRDAVLAQRVVSAMQGSTPNSPFGPPCQKRDYVPPNTSAFWTCGVNITGTASCNGGESFQDEIKVP